MQTESWYNSVTHDPPDLPRYAQTCLNPMVSKVSLLCSQGRLLNLISFFFFSCKNSVLTFAGLPYTIYTCMKVSPLPTANAKNTAIWSIPADKPPPHCSTNKGKNMPTNERAKILSAQRVQNSQYIQDIKNFPISDNI